MRAGNTACNHEAEVVLTEVAQGMPLGVQKIAGYCATGQANIPQAYVSVAVCTHQPQHTSNTTLGVKQTLTYAHMFADAVAGPLAPADSRVVVKSSSMPLGFCLAGRVLATTAVETQRCMYTAKHFYLYDGLERLVHLESQLCLGADNGGSFSSTAVTLQPCTNGNHQRWQQTRSGIIRPRHATNLCLNLAEFGTQDRRLQLTASCETATTWSVGEYTWLHEVRQLSTGLSLTHG
jgi:hypothetical protein